MCNYSLCAVYRGLFPLSVPYLFLSGTNAFLTQITLVFPSLSWQRAAPACATATGDVRWTKTAGTAFASRAGEEQAVTSPWRPCAQTARTMKEVREPGPECLGKVRARAWARKWQWPHSYLLGREENKQSPKSRWIESVCEPTDWWHPLISLKPRPGDYRSWKRQGNRATV